MPTDFKSNFKKTYKQRMKNIIITILSLLFIGVTNAQTNPAITSWLQNTNGTKGRYYLTGNFTPITSNIEANVQLVQYSTNNVYVKATGIPSYVTGPYAIGTITTAANNNYTFKFPLNPTPATNHTSVGNGAIAAFIDGSVAFRARDAATYKNLGQWHQNAVYFENLGFDCSHGHPGPMTSDYHQHQNPSAFDISTVPASSICNIYLSDGLYVPDSNTHSPLIGFAWDGYPIYGSYGYSDPNDNTSAIKRIRTSYKLRNITSRTTLPNGTVAAGPAFTDFITSMLPGSTPLQAILGAYEEDFDYIANYGDLDQFNGRFCKTPEYPDGMYCYFASIDSLNNPEYPYLVGNSYYGVVAAGPPNQFTKATINEAVTTYIPSSTAVSNVNSNKIEISLFPNPSNDFIVIQSFVAVSYDRIVELINLQGKLIRTEILRQGSTMCNINTETIYAGTYLVRVIDNNINKITTKKLEIIHK